MSADVMTQEKIYTVKEAAEWLRTSERTIRSMIRDGRLSAYRVGGEYRITESDLRALRTRQDQQL